MNFENFDIIFDDRDPTNEEPARIPAVPPIQTTAATLPPSRQEKYKVCQQPLVSQLAAPHKIGRAHV